MPPSHDRLTRRNFLRTAATGAGALLAPGVSRAAKRKDVNVLLIFTDDQGTLDLNCYGSKDLYTPNLDKLAASGVRFSQFYVGAPVCSPSRAALLTGRCPQRAGVPGNVGQSGGLPPEQVTIAEMMKAAGYRTALFGKWHLGHDENHDPNAQGFDEFLGHKNGCIDNYSHFFYWSGPNRHDLWRDRKEIWEDGSYFPSMIVREAKRFLGEATNRPFFMYLPFNMPHYPMQGMDKYRKMYAKLPEPRQAYAAFISTIDEKVGEVLAELDRLDLRDNTLVIFLSDHGHSIEERCNFGGGNAGPYRGNKFTLWEGGLRVPCIVSLKGVVPAGQVRDQLAVSVDWMPTIAAVTGVTPPARRIDGKNILPVIRSGDAPSPHDVFHWESGGQWAVRKGTWKLVANKKALQKPPKAPGKKPNPKDAAKAAERNKMLGTDALFLSNMDVDVTEQKNIAAQHPDIVTELRKLHDLWAEDVKKQ